ncbi:MAG TPA: glycosyltransferase family 4 protein [Steroidobacteraceae bacterium]|nr:glycosyltransferase family 4 protein [Steroidobacteraceae bacterium]
MSGAGLRRLVVFTHAGGSPHHGPNMRWYYLGQALRPLGWQVEIVSASWFHKYVAPPTLANGGTEDVDGLTYHWMRTRPYPGHGLGQVLNQWDYVRGAWRFAGADSRGAAHAVVASSPHPFVFLPAWRFARRRGALLLFETRDLWPLAIRELGGYGRMHPYVVLLGVMERFAARRADALVSVKPGDWKYFAERYGIARERQHYLPNGFLPAGPPPSPGAGKARAGFTVGYVGALSDYYCLDVLLGAARRLRGSDVRFRIAGGGSDAARLAEAARDLPNVEFLGTVPKREVPALLAGFDACFLGLKDISANRYGISCNKLFDYMAAAKPVVASYRTDHDPVQAAGCGITVLPDRGEGIVEAIEWLRAHPADALEMGRRGRAYFEVEHDFRRVAERYDRLLRQGSHPEAPAP